MKVADSPCTKVCSLDAAGHLCTGCGRTVEEIAIWGEASPEQREAILALLPARLATLKSSSFTR
jgi:predicted Fe-S protein YdhL (DUF1289 family)